MPAACRIINPTRLQQKDRGIETLRLEAWGVRRSDQQSVRRDRQFEEDLRKRCMLSWKPAKIACVKSRSRAEGGNRRQHFPPGVDTRPHRGESRTSHTGALVPQAVSPSLRRYYRHGVGYFPDVVDVDFFANGIFRLAWGAANEISQIICQSRKQQKEVSLKNTRTLFTKTNFANWILRALIDFNCLHNGSTPRGCRFLQIGLNKCDWKKFVISASGDITWVKSDGSG